MKINLFHKTRGSTPFKKRIKHHFDLFKYGKFLQIFLMVGFFVGLFFAVNPIHGLGSGYIEVDVGTSDGPYEGSKFIVRDEYGGYREYRSNIDGDIQICVDYDNGRCDLQYQDLGKIFYINQDCDNFSDGKYTCDKSEVKVSIEGDELGEPYARYFYTDDQGNPTQELYYAAGDGEYIFNNDGGDCIEIKSKVKALGLEEGQFEFVLRNNYGEIKQTTTNDENGDIRFCGDYPDGTYLITQNFNNTYGYIIDSAIIKVNISDDGYGNKNIQYHKDGYLGQGNTEEFCFDGDDVNYLNWGYQYQALDNYYSYFSDYVSFDSWGYRDWNSYANFNGGGYWSDYYDFQDWNGYAFYNRKFPTCIEIVTSVDSNKPIQSGQFEFGLYNNNYHYNNGISFSTAKNNGSGVIIFSELDDGGGYLSEYYSCDINHEGNTQGEHSVLCYDVDGLFENQGGYPSYNYEFNYLVGQKTYASGCDNYSCDTGTIEVDVSLTCDDTYYQCNASLTYSDTGFFNVIYTATFNANGANSIGANMISGVTITMPSITRQGYLALGWSTDSGATVAEYAVGESVTLTGDVVLYAITRPATATFLPGQTVNLTFKSLAKGTTVNLNFQSNDYSITKIVRTGSIPAGVTTGLLSTADSETPIIGWYTNGILYYYSESDILYLNEDSSFMFYNLSYLTELDVSELNTSKVTNMQSLFAGSYYLSGLDVSNWDTSNVTNMSYMFDSNNSNELDVSKWDTSNVTDMAGMFFECRSLKSLDVSKWDTSKVTNMSHMFRFCDSLTGLDVSKWDTSNVTNMNGMFQYCYGLTELDVSKWNTSNVTDMHGMFLSSSYLTKLDVSGWDTSNVTDMGQMFKFGCPTEFDVSKWNTSKVVNMMEMFRGCSNLTGLDVRGWNTSSVTNMGQMFYNCSNLNTIYASTGFITSGVTYSTDMFQNTPKLVGGHGTKSPSLGMTKSGAVLDSETQSGYLTYDIAVSYRTSTGVELARQIIDVGDTTVAPTIIRTGYAVSGWYTDTGLTTLFDFSQSLRKYTELYVMWKCDTGYMLSGDGVTCIPLTYEVRHFIKNAGALSYTLSGTEIFTGIAGEQVYFDDLSQTYPSCIVYSRGSLTGDETGPGEIETKTDIAGDGSTVINLFYDRNTYTVDLSRDFGIDVVEGEGTYECGQEVQIRAYPIEGYHFDVWEGEVN